MSNGTLNAMLKRRKLEKNDKLFFRRIANETPIILRSYDEVPRGQVPRIILLGSFTEFHMLHRYFPLGKGVRAFVHFGTFSKRCDTPPCSSVEK